LTTAINGALDETAPDTRWGYFNRAQTAKAPEIQVYRYYYIAIPYAGIG